MYYHQEPLDGLLKGLRVDPKRGLSRQEADARLKRGGADERQHGRKPPLLIKYLTCLQDGVTLILLAAALVASAVARLGNGGGSLSALVLVGLILLRTGLVVMQDNRREEALAAFDDNDVHTAKVLRDGTLHQIPVSKVTKGDVILLEQGDCVPADIRLIESKDLQCMEANLTGESGQTKKNAHSYVPEDAPLHERSNMAYCGTVVTGGRAVGAVVATGSHTEGARASERLGEVQGDSILWLELLGEKLRVLVLALCAALFCLGLGRDMEPLGLFLALVSLAVVAVPEGLGDMAASVLALGVERMRNRGAVVQNLTAVETLARVSVICSDKAGVLTQNRMTVLRIWAVGRAVERPNGDITPHALHLLRLGALCSDGWVEEDEAGVVHHNGDPTETSIVAMAKKYGLLKSELDESFPRVAEIPFRPDRGRMATVHEVNGRLLAIVKGGVDSVLPLCVGADEERAMKANEEMGTQSLRVLAVACKEVTSLPFGEDMASLEEGLQLMGLIGMIDPPNEKTAEAVQLCKKAGIKPVMITGEHPVTAGAVARELGILEGGDRVLTGAELQKMDDENLKRNIQRYSVFARVGQQQKARIVKAWQAKGAVVAATGNNIEGISSLIAADVGCATMSSADKNAVAHAGDLMLADGSFSTALDAVKKSRGIADNTRKAVRFLLACGLGEVIAVLLSMLLGWGMPFMAVHLLIISAATICLPALALGAEPEEGEVMQRKPEEKGLFSGRLWVTIVLEGLLLGLVALVAYYVGAYVEVSAVIAPSQGVGTSMAFLTLLYAQLLYAQCCRSPHSLFRIGLRSNRAMLEGTLFPAALALIATLIPFLEAWFGLVDLSLRHWGRLLALAITPLVLIELGKLAVSIRRRIV